MSLFIAFAVVDKRQNILSHDDSFQSWQEGNLRIFKKKKQADYFQRMFGGKVRKVQIQWSVLPKDLVRYRKRIMKK